jgi:hypothetical protein
MLLPYKKFTIETQLTVNQAIQTLAQVVQSSRPFAPNPFSQERRHFVGSIGEADFKLVRNVYYLNSFLPEIKGLFEPSGAATKINITMSCNPLVLVSFVAVFAFFAFFLMVYLPMGVMSDALMVLSTFTAGGLGYLVSVFAFALNMTRDRDYLFALFLKKNET